MSEFLAVSAAVRAIYAFAAIFVLIQILGHLDKKIGWNVREALSRIHADPQASAVYLGARLLAGAVLLGMLFG